jgi:hypothetical protein
MLYEGLVPIRELLSDRGSLFLHLAPNVSHLARTLLDEIFGAEKLPGGDHLEADYSARGYTRFRGRPRLHPVLRQVIEPPEAQRNPHGRVRG